jgi:hypothetical protein
VAWCINYSWHSVRDSNVAPPKYKSEALPLQPNELLARRVVKISYEGVCEWENYIWFQKWKSRLLVHQVLNWPHLLKFHHLALLLNFIVGNLYSNLVYALLETFRRISQFLSLEWVLRGRWTSSAVLKPLLPQGEEQAVCTASKCVSHVTSTVCSSWRAVSVLQFPETHVDISQIFSQRLVIVSDIFLISVIHMYALITSIPCFSTWVPQGVLWISR